jgi:hypothetical protein
MFQLGGLGKQKTEKLVARARRLGMTPQRYLKHLVEEDLAFSERAKSSSFEELLGPGREVDEAECPPRIMSRPDVAPVELSDYPFLPRRSCMCRRMRKPGAIHIEFPADEDRSGRACIRAPLRRFSWDCCLRTNAGGGWPGACSPCCPFPAASNGGFMGILTLFNFLIGSLAWFVSCLR